MASSPNEPADDSTPDARPEKGCCWLRIAMHSRLVRMSHCLGSKADALRISPCERVRPDGSPSRTVLLNASPQRLDPPPDIGHRRHDLRGRAAHAQFDVAARRVLAHAGQA